MPIVTAFAPGRVNLIGEHTDYTGGLVLPLALEVGITVRGERGGDVIRLTSATETTPVELTLAGEPVDPASALTGWGAYIAGAVRQLQPTEGFVGEVTTTMPTGGTGLSSSSALTCSTLLAFGAVGDPIDIAKMAQRAEIEATGVQIGLMDQIASMCGVAQHAVRIDCRSFDVETVAVPEAVDILVVHSGQPRMLADSEYNDRRQACALIEAEIGPLRDCDIADIGQLSDPILRRRAEHVILENERVDQTVAAFRAGDTQTAAKLLNEGHRSLSELYEVSTPIVDAMAERLRATPGVLAARLTGGGFGGCLVALSEPGVELDVPVWWMRATPGAGASVS